MALSFHALEHRGNPLSHADAHGGDAVPSSAIAQGMEQRGRDSGSARSQRMTNGDCPAPDIDFLLVEPQHPDASERLSRKRLVQFDEVDLLELQPGTRESFLHRRNWARP